MAKIRIVDDIPANREYLVTLPARRYQGRLDAEADEFIGFIVPAAARMQDQILLDLNMPRKDGREVLSEIKTDPELRHIPVVILTTSRADQDVIQTYDLGANAYVVKPVDLDQLVTIVQKIEEFWFTIVKVPHT